MAGPEDWGAQPVADDPTAWGAQPAQAETPAGTFARGVGMLGSSEGRAQLWEGVKKLPADMLQGMLDQFETPGKAMREGLSPEEETSFGVNTALMTIGSGAKFKLPKGMDAAIAPVAKEFDDTVIAPAATRLDAYARTGDVNGVRLEPPQPDVQAAPVRPIDGSPFAGIPRSVAAKTNIPEVDSVLNSPVTKSVIDNPVVDRHYDVPYMAGGSTPLNDPTVYIDRHVPKEMTVGGVTFDPADPWIVHENVEQHTMELLAKGGMGDEEAYRVAHFQFAEPAEQAWYTAHGIDQVAAEKQQATWLPRIQHENPESPPPNLYKAPYPHDHVAGAEREAVTETPPSPDEIARGMDIIRNAPELQPKSAQPMLQQARDLGVIGPDQPPLNTLPPKEAGRAAMAARRPDEKITGEVGDQPTAWRQRWERTLDKMNTPADARKLIGAAVDANDEFMAARQGDMSPAQTEQLASVAGLDPTKIDVKGTSAKIKTNAEIRNTIEAFRGINDKIIDAARNLSEKHGVDDDAEAMEMTRLELQRDLLLNTAVASKEFAGLRAEFGRIGNTIQEFMTAQREANTFKDFLRDKMGRTPQDVRERAKMIADTPPDQLPKTLEAMRNNRPGWAFWLWQQGLISGLVTHTKYLFVNTATTYLERVIAPEVAALIGKARGDNVSAMAPLWANVGMIRGLPDAFAAAGQAFKTGLRVPLESELELTKRGEENPELTGAKTPYVNQLGPDWGIWKRVFNETQLDKAAKALGIPGKSANMIHTFYKVLSERASASSRAYEAAFADGAKGDEFWERYNHHLANPSDENLSGAVDDAYSGAFMEKLGDRSGKLAKALASNPVTKWMFPFQHIPWNIERMTIRYSPLAIFGPEMRGALMGEKGHPAQNLALAKVVVGSSIIGYFVEKGLSGQATPDYPLDPKERRRWQMLGIQPNSVQVGDQWISSERLGPPGNLVRIGANLGAIIKDYDGKDDEGLMKAFGAAMTAAVNQVGDETGFQTLRNLIDVFEGHQPAQRFVAWQAGSFVPPGASSFTAQGASFMDPYMRQANTLIDGLKYRVPGERETLLPKRDALYGEPVPNPGYHTILRESPISGDPVKAELDHLGYYPAAPQKKIGGVPLTPEEYDRYEATAGPLVKQVLSAAIQNPRWQAIQPPQRVEIVKEYIKAAREKAAQAVQMAYPDLIQKGIDARHRQIAGQP